MTDIDNIDIYGVTNKSLKDRMTVEYGKIDDELVKTYTDYYNEWVTLRGVDDSLQNPDFIQKPSK